ncbi:MAG TPA: mucoidy inhibitor MuiA family protein [Polyangia bacterium]|nr:mucoidy inhibitor MuiA family protein [Polyangia bacterium]
MRKNSAAKWSLALCVPLLTIGCLPAKGSAPPPQHAAAPVADGDGPEFADVPDATDAPGDAEATALESGVTRVTMYSDRAQVTRRATAEATTEPRIFAFRKLPGWVDDGSVRVSASAGRIVDVRVERSFLAKSSDKSYRKAERELKELTNQLAAVNDEISVLDAQKAQIEAIKAFSLDKFTKDTTIGDVSVQTYGDVLTFISDSLRQTAKARREAVLRQDEIAPKLAASGRKLEEMKSLLSLEETTVLVTLQSSRPAQSTVELTYMLPGATWEPMHELRVSTSDSNEVEVISFAVVTQTSGEDWGTAELSFSTQSTIQSVRIPELEALTLGDSHTATRILTSKLSSFSRAQKAFEGQNELWNKVHQKSYAANEHLSFEQAYQSNMEYLQVVQSKTVRLFEALENRGTTAQFKASAAHNVRGDGHPTRMRIGYSTLKSGQKILAVPEQSLNAARTLGMVNTTGQPLLPGKVALYQDGAFIGMTDIDFIAQGEDFSLFFNVADHLKLSRTLDRKQSSLVHRQQSRMLVTFVVTVENLLAQETALTLADRIPVSENREIRVGNVRIAPACNPDSQGILRWDLVLKPKEKREFRISYQVDYPSELILDARRRRSVQPGSPSPSPASPMNNRSGGKYEIQDQLMDLEEML